MPKLNLSCLATEINGPCGTYKYYYSRKDKTQYARLKGIKKTRNVTSPYQLACMKHWRIADTYYTQMTEQEKQVWKDAVKRPGVSSYDVFMSETMTILHDADRNNEETETHLVGIIEAQAPGPSGGFRAKCNPRRREPRRRRLPSPPWIRCGVYYSFEPTPPWWPGGFWRAEWMLSAGYYLAPTFVDVFVKLDTPGADWFFLETFAGNDRTWTQYWNFWHPGEVAFKIVFKHSETWATIGKRQFWTTRSWTRNNLLDNIGPSNIFGWRIPWAGATSRIVRLEWRWLLPGELRYPGTMKIKIKPIGNKYTRWEFDQVNTNNTHLWFYTLDEDCFLSIVQWEWYNRAGELIRKGGCYIYHDTIRMDFITTPFTDPTRWLPCDVYHNPPT